MCEEMLLKRIEVQAVEIDRLHRCIADMQATIAAMQERVLALPRTVYEDMVRGAVNCGQSSGCGLARMRIESLDAQALTRRKAGD